MREYTDKLTDKSKKSISDFVFYNCGIEQCEGGQFYGPKRRDYHFIHFVVKGEGTLQIQDKSYPLMHCGSKRFVLDCRNVSFYERQIEHILNISGKQLSTHLQSNGIMYNLIGTLLEELGADDPEDLDISIPYQAKQYMEMHYHNSLQIADVAEAVGVHANYLANIFQEKYHVTPKQYLSNLRIKKACKLLLDTDHPVYIIANSVGFTDQLAFSKFFRKTIGIPPSDYRMQRRNTDVQN